MSLFGSRKLSFVFFWSALAMTAAAPGVAYAYEVEGPRTITLNQEDSVFLSIQNTADAAGPKEMRFFHTDHDGSGGYFQMYCKTWEDCQAAKTLYEGALADGSKLRLGFEDGGGHIATVEIVKPKGILPYLADATDYVLRGMSSVSNRTLPAPSLKSAGLSERAESGLPEVTANSGNGGGNGGTDPALLAGVGK